ncbi:MAG: hypothetical protein RLZZ595_528 [Bacteroidota bacterium]|jgi:hypothetical protein
MRESKPYPMKTFVAGLILLICTVGIYSFEEHPEHKSASISSNTASKTEDFSFAIHPLLVSIQEKIGKAGVNLSEDILSLALVGFSKLNAQERLSKDSILTIIDYSKSSKEKRLFVIDLKTQNLLFNSVVAHGRNTGEEFAKQFSNQMNSHKSSLGFFVTQTPYQGSNGYSLALEGVDNGFNDMAKKRAIVMHGAPYASEDMIKTKGYLGRSFGCPSLPPQLNKQVIETIKGGNCLFAYYPDKKYLNESKLLNG